MVTLKEEVEVIRDPALELLTMLDQGGKFAAEALEVLRTVRCIQRSIGFLPQQILRDWGRNPCITSEMRCKVLDQRL